MYDDTIWLVYKTDAWHSYSSRDIIGVCTNAEQCIARCKEKAELEGETIDEYQMWNLVNLKQTQGYSGDGEFHYEELDKGLNELI